MFLLTLHREKGRELFVRLLCQQQESSLLTDFIKITSSIIQQRETQHQQHSHWTLDTLPKSFIGEIASNLSQKQYASLCRTNRAIYIGCNDPNRLLNVTWHCGRIKLDQYPQIKKMKISMHREILQLNQFSSARLESLCLSGVSFQANSGWNAFLRDTSIHLPRLRHLDVSPRFDTIPSPENVHHLFTKFHMIQHLEVNYFITTVNVSLPPRLFTDSFPNLNSLTLTHSDSVAKGFLKHRAADLYQLHLDSLCDITDQSEMAALKRTKFTKLQRLHISNEVDWELTDHILGTAPVLTAFSYLIDYRSTGVVKEEIQKRITGVLKEKRSLTDLHVEVWCSQHLDTACQAIEFGLVATRKWKRKLLRIGIEALMPVEYEEGIVLVSRILTRLALCDIKEFVLFSQIGFAKHGCNCYIESRSEDSPCEWCRRGPKIRQSLMKEMNHLVTGMGTVALIRSEEYLFVIKNKGSAINSYKKWWNEDKFDRWPVIY